MTGHLAISVRCLICEWPYAVVALGLHVSFTHLGYKGRGLYSTRMIPSASQNKVAVTFPSDWHTLNFFGCRSIWVCPLHSALLCFRSGMVHPCLVASHYVVQEPFPSSLNRWRLERAICKLRLLCFSLRHLATYLAHSLRYPCFSWTAVSTPVFLNHRVLASIIPGSERFSWNLSF